MGEYSSMMEKDGNYSWTQEHAEYLSTATFVFQNLRLVYKIFTVLYYIYYIINNILYKGYIYVTEKKRYSKMTGSCVTKPTARPTTTRPTRPTTTSPTRPTRPTRPTTTKPTTTRPSALCTSGQVCVNAVIRAQGNKLY